MTSRSRDSRPSAVISSSCGSTSRTTRTRGRSRTGPWDLPSSNGRSPGHCHRVRASGLGLQQIRSRELPNYEMPMFNGIGANEYIMDVTRRRRLHLGGRYALPLRAEHLVPTRSTAGSDAHQRRNRLPVHVGRSRRRGPLMRASAEASPMTRGATVCVTAGRTSPTAPATS